MSYKKNAILALLSSTAVLSGSVQALDGSLLGMDYNISGFIRAEMAVKTVDEETPYNQRGNLFNGVAVERRGALPAFQPTMISILPSFVWKTRFSCALTAIGRRR